MAILADGLADNLKSLNIWNKALVVVIIFIYLD